MPQQTPAQARVIDPILTQVARGYKNAEFIGHMLFPPVDVAQRGGNVIEFGKEHFKRLNTKRAPGTAYGTVNFGYAGRKYALENHALQGAVPEEVLEDARQVPGLDLGANAVNGVMRLITLDLECEQADIARNAANYGPANKVTLSGTSQWTDQANSTPGADLRAGKSAIRKLIGRYPNTMVMGEPVFAALQEHPEIQEHFKYTSGKSITAEMLAAYFGFDAVGIGGAVYADADGDFVDVWGNDVVLAYVDISSLAQMGSPSYGYTYRLKGHPIAKAPYFNNEEGTWKYPVKSETSAEITGADAGYLIKDAV